MSETSQQGERSLARSSAVMAAGTVVSRVLGMVKSLMLAAVMGFAVTGDAFDVANTLPNQFYLLLAGGVLNAVHDDGGDEFVNRLLTLSIALMAVATVAATALAPFLVQINATSRWSSQTLALSTAFAFICLPQIFFYGLYTLLGQVLNARGQFAAYMWAPVVANIVSIAGMLVFIARGFPTQAQPQVWTSSMVWLLGGSATAGIVAQALVLVIPLYRAGFRYRPRWGFRGVGLRTASKVAGWTFAALGLSQLGFVVTSRVLTGAQSAAHLAGEVVAGKASYSNAFLLFMLPHSLVTVSLVTALFTRMSRAASAGDLAEVRADFSRGMRLTAVATVPSTVGIFVLGSALTSVLFFNNSRVETQGIYHVTLAMMLGLVPFGTLYLLQRVFYAFEDARTPFLLQVLVTGVATVGNLLAATLPVHWTGIGVGVAQAVSNLAGAAVGLVLVRRRLSGLGMYQVVRVYVRLLLAALAAAAVTAPLVWGAREIVGAGRVGALVALLIGGAVFAAVYLALAAMMGVRELTDLTAPLSARARRFLPRRRTQS
jgi:putative peptidoglycan lipid II flippase